ncbi:plasmid pRiA4b ORF-3 family protein [Intrasporangium sp. DVR]|uniref:plasmid pRiA4b ORF-3 family protein n=1 Tax=Intrasporangium sp. DVR TaxID=3127867 RepID=UPI00313A6F4D
MTQPPDGPRTPAEIKAWVESLSADQVMTLAESMMTDTVGQALGTSGLEAFGDRNPPIELPAPPRQPVLLTIRVALDDTEPQVWRRLCVPGALHLGEVHDALQQAMGWSESHLHRFSLGPAHSGPYFVTDFDQSEGDAGTPETDARLDQVLREPGDRLTYEYDLGDGWTHTITLEQVDPLPDPADPAASADPGASPAAYPLVCLGGERACPPEDVGGVPGYEEAAEWVRRGRNRRHTFDNGLSGEEMEGWLPDGWDPDHFDVDEVNAALARLAPRDLDTALAQLPPTVRQLIGRLSRPARFELDDWLAAPAWAEPATFTDAEALALTTGYRVLLDAVGDGITLTAAGYLPPRVVSRIFAEARLAEDWIGAGNREDLTPPVGDLRDRARRAGLVRRLKGRLLPTAKGRRLRDDPPALLDVVLTQLAREGEQFDRLASALWLVASVHHPSTDRRASTSDEDIAAVADLLSVAGWRDGEGYPLEDRHVSGAIWETMYAVKQMVRGAGIEPAEAADVTRRLARAVLRRME